MTTFVVVVRCGAFIGCVLCRGYRPDSLDYPQAACARQRRGRIIGGMRLTTERLVLRELEEGDAPAAHAYEQRPEVVRYVIYDVRTLEESLAYIRGIQETVHAVPRTVFDLAVTLREDDRC